MAVQLWAYTFFNFKGKYKECRKERGEGGASDDAARDQKVYGSKIDISREA